MADRDRAFLMARVLASFALASALSASLANAQGGPVASIDLGPGVRVERVPCRPVRGPSCGTWVPTGFTFGSHPELAFARAFARTSTGRIVAVRSSALPAASGTWRLLRTSLLQHDFVWTSDDLGETWQAARWEWDVGPVGIAFDPASTNGVAVGVSGMVWSTDDGGGSWTLRRRDIGRTYAAVAVVGRTCLLTDDRGVTWISRDGGFALETLTRDPITTERDRDSLIVRFGDRGVRISRRGDVLGL